jgi:ATP-binding cassette, subfamily B, bacterial MsbA
LPLGDDAMRAYRRLLSYVRPHLPMLGLGIVGMIMFAATSAAWAFFTQKFVDKTFLEEDRQMILLVPLALVGLFVVRGLGDFMQTYFPGHVGRRIVKRLRGEIFDHYLNLPISYFDRNSAGTLLSTLTYNTEQVATATTDSITTFIRETLTIALLLTYLFYLNARLTAIVLILAPVIAWLITTINRHFRRYSQRIQASMGDVTRIAKEAIEAPRVVKVFNAQAHESAQFERVNERNRLAYMKLLLTKGMSNPVVQVLAVCGLAVVLYVATRESLEGKITPGEFFGFIVALISITQPLRALVNVASPCSRASLPGKASLLCWMSDASRQAGLGLCSGPAGISNIAI